MKRNSIIFALLLMVAGLQTAFAQYDMKVWHNGTFEHYFVNYVDSVTYGRLVDQIVLSPLTLELQVGETAQLNVTVLPENASDKTFIWQHSGNVSVSSTGLVTAQYKGTGYIRCIANDASGVASATCQVVVTKPDGDDPDDHEFVDLGLPSGTLWATCNLGATEPEGFGDFFAWGETAPKDNYGSYGDYSNYLFYDAATDNMTKYNTTDRLIELMAEDDAATAFWGENWQIPSQEQCEELIDEANTTLQWTELNGVEGMLITSIRNAKSIFLPNAGYMFDSLMNSGHSYSWTRTLDDIGTSSAYALALGEFRIVESGWYRHIGLPVRPVRR